MLIQDNLFLTRSNPSGLGGTQFLYRVKDYGLSALSGPQEEISMIHWEVEVIKFKNSETAEYEVCHSTELADKTLKFYTDKSLNEFLEKAFQYFEELDSLEKMLPQESWLHLNQKKWRKVPNNKALVLTEGLFIPNMCLFFKEIGRWL